MPSIKKNVLTLILLILVYGWFFVSHAVAPKQKPVAVLGADANLSVFVQPQAGRSPIIDAINNAQKEILVEVYILSDKQIINALENAKNRGLVVDVMLEEHPFGGGNFNSVTEQSLTSAGVLVKWANPVFSLTHEKAIIIDGSEAFILSQNLSASSFTKNREYDVIDTNPQDVSEIRSIFINDWDRKSFTVSTSNLVVSPDNSRSLITGLIQSATKNIDIEIEDINDNQIVSDLSNKAKNVQVRIIVPTLSQINSNSDSIKELSKSGVLIRTMSSPYVHAKLIVVDNSKAYVGSVNLSSQSMDKNRELGIILSQADIMGTLLQTFSTDWDNGKDFNAN